MRVALTILFYSISQSIFAGNYYVANLGSDSNSGTIGNPFATIAKANSVAVSGDFVYLNRGDSWQEQIIPVSGVVYGAYGTGNQPIITGLQTVTGLTDSSHIWSATISNSVADLNTVLIDGVMRAKARNPNTGYSTYTSYLGKNKIVGAVTDTESHVGADIVVRVAPWIIDRSRIISQSGDTFNLRESLTYASPFTSNGYFIQNQVKDLDTYGEWTFDSTTKTLRVYSIGEPVVQYSTLDTILHLSHKDNVSINDISFQGANESAIHIDSSNNVTIRDCSINYSGNIAISGKVSDYVTITNDSIQNTLTDAIYFYNYNITPFDTSFHSDYLTITNNYIKNSGFLAGMGRMIETNGNNTYMGIVVMGLEPKIENNVIDSTGFNGIVFNGKKAIVHKNVVSNFCFIKNDGGGIVSGIGGYFPSDYNDSSLVDSNVVINGIGAISGTTLTDKKAQGIYLDDYTRYITLNANTVYNANEGVFLHNNSLITVTNNTLFDNYTNGVRLTPNSNVSQSLVFKKNKIYSSTAALPFYESISLSVSNLGTMDSNYFSHPFDETKIVKWNTTNYTLPDWQAFSSQDVHSLGTPSGVTSATALLKYNTSDTAQTFVLSGTYIDITGAVYYNYIVLQPFTSAILFKSTTELFPQYPLNLFRIHK